MTVPENFMTYYGPIDRLRYRVHARNAGPRSKTSSNTPAIASKIKIRYAFHGEMSCPPLHPSRLVHVLPSQTPATAIEIP
jgi:hypothetical protein